MDVDEPSYYRPAFLRTHCNNWFLHQYLAKKSCFDLKS
jgi:hypothetical protein